MRVIRHVNCSFIGAIRRCAIMATINSHERTCDTASPRSEQLVIKYLKSQRLTSSLYSAEEIEWEEEMQQTKVLAHLVSKVLLGAFRLTVRHNLLTNITVH